jgi:serine/threonine-protein kinase RsbW
MAESSPNVRLSLANTPENVVLVREMLSGVAQAIELGGSDLDDARTAVTEACNNVVLHAYEGEVGPLEVEVYLEPGKLGVLKLGVLVRDHGIGMPAEPESPEMGDGGIGLHVIRTLAHGVEFRDSVDGGTEVWMEFAATAGAGSLELSQEGAPKAPMLPLPREDAPKAPTPALPREDAPEAPTFALSRTPTTTTISIGPISLARTVLPRLVITLAARAHFSTDRISDAQMLADALVAHAHAAVSGDTLSIGVAVEPRDLELHIAPLGAGRAQRLIGDSELDGLGRVIERLADRHQVASAGSHETLTLGLSDPR